MKKQLKALQEARRTGIGRLLLMARRDFMARLVRKMGDRVDTGFLHASGALLPFIDIEGTRSVELARRMGISKQAVGKLVRELEEAGFLMRVADDADGRAFLVRFTDAGIAYLLDMHDAISQIEREYETLVGGEQMSLTRAVLGKIAYGDEPD